MAGHIEETSKEDDLSGAESVIGEQDDEGPGRRSMYAKCGCSQAHTSTNAHPATGRMTDSNSVGLKYLISKAVVCKDRYSFRYPPQDNISHGDPTEQMLWGG